MNTHASELVKRVSEYRGARCQNSRNLAEERIRQLGRDLHASGGTPAMERAYDFAQEMAGAAGTQWVSPLWTGIGGWTA